MNNNPKSINNYHVIIKRYFVTRFWLALVLNLMTVIIPLAFWVSSIISICNEYFIFIKAGKMAYRTEKKNHKFFFNRWLLSILLIIGGIVLLIFIFTSSFMERLLIEAQTHNNVIFENEIEIKKLFPQILDIYQNDKIMVLIALLSLLAGFILYIINIAMLYKFLDRFEHYQDDFLNGFYARFIKSIIFKFVCLLFFISAFIGFDITNVYANTKRMFMGTFIGMTCFFIGWILQIINWHKVCYKMDVSE
jgi:uncharacterized membrane protein